MSAGATPTARKEAASPLSSAGSALSPHCWQRPAGNGRVLRRASKARRASACFANGWVVGHWGDSSKCLGEHSCNSQSTNGNKSSAKSALLVTAANDQCASCKVPAVHILCQMRHVVQLPVMSTVALPSAPAARGAADPCSSTSSARVAGSGLGLAIFRSRQERDAHACGFSPTALLPTTDTHIHIFPRLGEC